MDRPCTGCLYHKVIHHAAHRDHVDRCFRPRTMQNGSTVECGMNGFDAAQERDAMPEPQRRAGDKCGPAAKYWGSEL